MNQSAAQFFRAQMQSARESTLQDAEAFNGIIHLIERIGAFEAPNANNLYTYQTAIRAVAQRSDLFELSDEQRHFHTPFDTLYDMVRNARNDSFHQGANARHLTQHCIELALILEDALRNIENEPNEHTQGDNTVEPLLSDYMIRNPVTASLWQPISFIRQQMLVNSFSFLPFFDSQWYLISDASLAKYLSCLSNNQRRDCLRKSLGDASNEVMPIEATCKRPGTTLREFWEGSEGFSGKPVLIVNDDTADQLLGIITAFDLL